MAIIYQSWLQGDKQSCAMYQPGVACCLRFIATQMYLHYAIVYTLVYPVKHMNMFKNHKTTMGLNTRVRKHDSNYLDEHLTQVG